MISLGTLKPSIIWYFSCRLTLKYKSKSKAKLTLDAIYFISYFSLIALSMKFSFLQFQNFKPIKFKMVQAYYWVVKIISMLNPEDKYKKAYKET